MKITLSAKFIDSLMNLTIEQQHVVLNSCKELMELDNDGVEAYEPTEDAPELLHEIHANMKKRVAAARRREERRRETTAMAFTAAPVVDDEPRTKYTFEQFKEATKAIEENADRLSAEERTEVKDLAQSIIEVIDILAVEMIEPKSRPMAKSANSYLHCDRSPKMKRVPIGDFLKR